MSDVTDEELWVFWQQIKHSTLLNGGVRGDEWPFREQETKDEIKALYVAAHRAKERGCV